ncbi:hypothetical protein GRI62_11760 [Erythrobacter arachoides]|uniref:Uncharacterized protein n=1 Tax=Aurantiacibacter arachoides TaxID=1850444 RepID=A0A845A153_9SPHN|nr:hypothetical protein [Aurantiacibacter arachoides]MXO94271.1 hypothetical protein [Aurantiacibacter arachoides]GGD64803.1 hypothetical protein GCM10011411_26370 [Aurantiacibacter arachoides]
MSDYIIVIVLAAIIATVYYKLFFKEKIAQMIYEDADGWRFGPIIKGETRSKGMPFSEIDVAKGFTIPKRADGHVNELTTDVPAIVGQLAAGKTIEIVVEIEGDEDAQFFQKENDVADATMTPFFRVDNVNWYVNLPEDMENADRWYGLGGRTPMTIGRHTITLPLSQDRWINVWGQNLPSFYEALKRAERFGLVFGGNFGLAHGVYTDRAVTLKIVSVKIV